jgi:phage-related protein
MRTIPGKEERMPRTTVVFYRDDDGRVPLLEWLDELPRKAQDKCRVKIERLRELGHELRRPEADFLRDGIYELRIRLKRVNYRMLYFFHRDTAAVLSHGLVKEKQVPAKEIDQAIEHKGNFEKDPQRHTHAED